MSGYKRDIVMRIVPNNGAESIHWFNDRLTDLGGHVRVGAPVYTRTMRIIEDLNRVRRQRIYARHVSVQIEILIATMADQWFLQEIESALEDPDNYSVFLSLDGGVTEREVFSPDETGMAPSPIRGKTVVGATFVLSLASKEPIGPRGPMMTDPGTGAELLQNGAMEQWVAGSPQGWTSSAAGGTITQESTIVHTAGGSALRLEINASGFVGCFQSGIVLKRNAWYRASGWFNSSSTGRGRIEFNNLRTGLDVKADGRTWAAQTQYAIDVAVATSYVYAEMYLRAAVDARADDTYRWYSLGYANPSVLYHDDLSLYGPVLRPGYSTW